MAQRNPKNRPGSVRPGKGQNQSSPAGGSAATAPPQSNTVAPPQDGASKDKSARPPQDDGATSKDKPAADTVAPRQDGSKAADTVAPPQDDRASKEGKAPGTVAPPQDGASNKAANTVAPPQDGSNKAANTVAPPQDHGAGKDGAGKEKVADTVTGVLPQNDGASMSANQAATGPLPSSATTAFRGYRNPPLDTSQGPPGPPPSKNVLADLLPTATTNICGKCGKVLKGGRWALQAHQLTSSKCAEATGNGPAREPCPMCGKMIAARDAWARQQHSAYCKPRQQDWHNHNSDQSTTWYGRRGSWSDNKSSWDDNKSSWDDNKSSWDDNRPSWDDRQWHNNGPASWSDNAVTTTQTSSDGRGYGLETSLRGEEDNSYTTTQSWAGRGESTTATHSDGDRSGWTWNEASWDGWRDRSQNTWDWRH